MLFKKRSNQDYDLIVLGGGSAAFAAAIRGVELGANVAVCEEGTIGGTCVNRGCVPSKNLLHAAELYHLYKENSFPGLPKGERPAEFREVIRQKKELVEEMRQKKYLDLLPVYPNISFHPRRTRFLSPHEVQVGEETLKGDKFVVATGASAAVVPIPGLDQVPYLTFKEALDLTELPRSMVIIGGGPIGLELGQVFSRFGSRVTVLEALPHILPNEDDEIACSLAHSLEEEGFEIHAGVKVNDLKREGKEIAALFSSNGQIGEVRAEAVLLAVGLKPNTAGLGLETVGVATDKKGFVQTNDELKTTATNIWSAGDVTGKALLVTVAALQGGIAAKNALGSREKVDYSLVPHAVFTSPQVASVGLKEEEAKVQGIKVQVARIPFEYVPKAAAVRDTRGLFKMVVDGKNYKILGVHIVSPQAADLIHLGLLAIRHKMTVGDLIRTTFVYPTLSEVYKIAAISFKKDVTKLSCCAV